MDKITIDKTYDHEVIGPRVQLDATSRGVGVYRPAGLSHDKHTARGSLRVGVGFMQGS